MILHILYIIIMILFYGATIFLGIKLGIKVGALNGDKSSVVKYGIIGLGGALLFLLLGSLILSSMSPPMLYPHLYLYISPFKFIFKLILRFAFSMLGAFGAAKLAKEF